MSSLPWTKFGWINVIVLGLASAVWWTVGSAAEVKLTGWLLTLAVVFSIEVVALFPFLGATAVHLPWLGIRFDATASEVDEVSVLSPIRLHSMIHEGIHRGFSMDLYQHFFQEMLKDVAALNGHANGLAIVRGGVAQCESGQWSIEIKALVESLVRHQSESVALCSPGDVGVVTKVIQRFYARHHPEMDLWFVGWSAKTRSLSKRHERAVEGAVSQLRIAYLLCARRTSVDQASGDI